MITTRRMLMLYACLVPVALTGCDLADYFPNVPQPVPVISPGYQVDIDGHPVRISGFDDCLREKDEARHAAAQDEKAAAVVLAHNHPSANTTPSQADKLITERLAQVLGMVDVKVLDHLIVGGSDIYSFAEHGLI